MRQLQIPALIEDLLLRKADPALIFIVMLQITQTKLAALLVLFDKVQFLLASSESRIKFYGEVQRLSTALQPRPTSAISESLKPRWNRIVPPSQNLKPGLITMTPSGAKIAGLSESQSARGGKIQAEHYQIKCKRYKVGQCACCGYCAIETE